MSNNTDSYKTHLRVQQTQIITAEEKALLHVEAQVNKLHRLHYMEDSLIDIPESTKYLWNEIKQAAQSNAGTNRVYMKWLEKRVKTKRDEEQERKLSIESEKEEGEEEDDNTEDLHYTKIEPACEHVSDSNTASYSGLKQIPQVLDKRPARPGSSIIRLLCSSSGDC
jgi:hypothetical protein